MSPPFQKFLARLSFPTVTLPKLFRRPTWLAAVTAVAVYIVAIGCATWPTSKSTAETTEAGRPDVAADAGVQLSGLPYCGITLTLRQTDNLDAYFKALDQIADLGADTVSLVLDNRQENGASTQIYIDERRTVTAQQLADIIKHAKSRKLRVLLMPIVLLDNPQGNEWRGTLRPASWSDWFTSYRDMLNHYAHIAQNTGVDVLVVGSELVSSEQKIAEWHETIHEVRQIYHGQLTYSSNWDHYMSVPFWDRLDIVGMNSYWKLGTSSNPEPTVEQIETRWHEIQKGLMDWDRKDGGNKPILIMEVGWCSLANMAYEPWDYTKTDEPQDLDLQKRLYEGFFRSWWGNPNMAGFMFWEWTTDGDSSGKGYTPQGKPAEQVLRDWLHRPRWHVR